MKTFIYTLLAVMAGGMLGGCQSIKHDAYYVLFSDEYAIDRATSVIQIDCRVFQYVGDTGEREKPEARIYVQGDLDGDRIEDTALLTMFDLAMSNNQVLFVSLSSRPKHVMLRKVGGKGSQDAETVAIKKSRIVIEGKRYAPDDAMCCPSIPFQASYAIQANAINEVNVTAPHHPPANLKNPSTAPPDH